MGDLDRLDDLAAACDAQVHAVRSRLEDFAASPACTAANSRVALVLGTEGDGLSRRTIAVADRVVRIPMAGGVDSLNVAAAAAVAFWALRTRA